MGPGSASALIGALSLEQAWHGSPGAGSLAHQKVRRSQEQLRGPLVCWALGNHPERSLQPSVTSQSRGKSVQRSAAGISAQGNRAVSPTPSTQEGV